MKYKLFCKKKKKKKNHITLFKKNSEKQPKLVFKLDFQSGPAIKMSKPF